MNPLFFGPLLEFGKDLIDKIFPDKTAQAAQRAAAELALYQAQQDGKLKELNVQLSAIVTEAQSTDPWTSRARPSFLYVIYLMILCSIPMGILSAFHADIAKAIASGMQAWLAAIPDSLYTLFGVGYLGYSGARMIEKKNGVTK